MKPVHAPSPPVPSQPVGILLAAGRGSRFDPSGAHNKLLTTLPTGAEAGLPVAFVAARRLRNALPRVIAVIDGDPDLTPAQAAHQRTLRDWLTKAGCEVIASPRARLGMGASLADAVQASLAAAPAVASAPPATAPAAPTGADAKAVAGGTPPPGWVIALADMPMIAPATTQEVAGALLAAGDPLALVAPVYEGQRGHPAGIGAGHLAALLALDGDRGAGGWFKASGFITVETGDAGVLRDIDHPEDLG
ncbi:hypothetical protein WM40_00680 [Robbsia andropogonis]|uniref:MobA-like NTP transferase domain-containing protein n=1 Tax=Robbsia andropogonis TaxID=28092 RepID=A0A0F5K5J4_9BURK|nr:NTP transferase domain-containing protein [Robbsia andropogonis]KKB65401.1 hypothetical protein WM40_00680 [Robbsia andropogonis]